MAIKNEDSKPLECEVAEEMLLDKDFTTNLRFYKEHNKKAIWYIYKGSHWVKVDISEIEAKIQEWIYKHPEYKESSVTCSRSWAEIRKQLSYRLRFDPNSAASRFGINFKDGFLCLHTGKFEANTNTSKSFRQSYLKVNYKKIKKIETSLRQVLFSLCDNNSISLCYLRGALRRCIEPSNVFKTGFYLHGPAGTGRSALLSWIQALVGRDNSVSLKITDLENFIKKGLLRNKKVILISEVLGCTKLQATYLQKLIEGDALSDNSKGDVTNEFYSNAIVFITSFYSLEKVFSNYQVFFDRLIPIECNTLIKNSSESLFNFLEQNSNEIIWWCRNCPERFFLVQIEVTKAVQFFFRKHSPLFKFVRLHLLPGGQIMSKKLIQKLHFFYQAENLPPESDLTLIKKILHIITVYFNVKVFAKKYNPSKEDQALNGGKLGQLRGHSGFKDREIGDTQSYWEPPNSDHPLQGVDPFEEGQICDYLKFVDSQIKPDFFY